MPALLLWMTPSPPPYMSAEWLKEKPDASQVAVVTNQATRLLLAKELRSIGPAAVQAAGIDTGSRGESSSRKAHMRMCGDIILRIYTRAPCWARGTGTAAAHAYE